MADLPLLLLGPILRRVEPRHVSVFVATHQPANARIALFDGQVDDAAQPAELASAEAHTTRFAAGFHAVVVTVDLADAAALLPGHLYSYDVRITPDVGAAQTLKDLGLLEDSTLPGYGTAAPASEEVEVVAIGYAENRLPSFVTCPAALEELVIAHASCRKPHGDGHPALQWLDAYVDDLDGAIDGRPHMLFLTGDQIYADDVATALLPGLTALGTELLAGVEQVPSPVDNSVSLQVNGEVLPAGFRQRVTGKSGFTSDWAASHLIGFGEFLAMYCAAWNPKLWPVLAVADTSDPGLTGALKAKLAADAASSQPPPDQPGAPDPPVALGRPLNASADVVTPLYGTTGPAIDALKEARREFLGAKAILDEFRREVPKVRRLLANAPTFMICDDHDVTDDWFMNAAIRAATTGNLFGRALVRNALAAHTVCQAWGNVPELWASDADHRKVLDGIARLFPDGWNGGLAQNDDDVVDTLGLKPDAQPKFDFSFSVDGPQHKVRVLDTRTRRQYDTSKSPPGLLSSLALDQQLPLEELEQIPEGHPLIVVSPAPVFGPPVLSDIGGQFLITKHDLFSVSRTQTGRALAEDVNGLPNGTPAGMQYYDVEHWGAHPAAFERLLERLSRHPRVVVLGGDVHFGTAYAMDWTGDQRTSRIVHFTSSAARNDWKDSAAHVGAPGVVHNLFALNGLAAGLQNIGLPMTRLGWSATLPPVVTDLQTEPPSTRLRVQSGPVLLSNEHFRASHPLTRPPDWVWRATPIVDVRAPADRPAAARIAEPAADLPQDGQAVRQYADLAAMHVQALRTAALARGMQFLNNVGLITFAISDDGIHVSQTLSSLRPRPDPNEKGDAYVVYETLLEPAPVPAPAAVGPAA